MHVAVDQRQLARGRNRGPEPIGEQFEVGQFACLGLFPLARPPFQLTLRVGRMAGQIGKVGCVQIHRVNAAQRLGQRDTRAVAGAGGTRAGSVRDAAASLMTTPSTNSMSTSGPSATSPLCATP